MILKTNTKEITIMPKIKHIIELTNVLKGKNLNEVFFKGATSNDINVLCLVIEKFSTIDGNKAFKNINEVYDFLDEYIIENKETVTEIYEKIAEEINNLGFFNKKMNKEELKMALVSNLDIDMDSIVTDIVKKVSEEKMRPEIEKEFQGFKG